MVIFLSSFPRRLHSMLSWVESSSQTSPLLCNYKRSFIRRFFNAVTSDHDPLRTLHDLKTTSERKLQSYRSTFPTIRNKKIPFQDINSQLGNIKFQLQNINSQLVKIIMIAITFFNSAAEAGFHASFKISQKELK